MDSESEGDGTQSTQLPATTIEVCTSGSSMVVDDAEDVIVTNSSTLAVGKPQHKSKISQGLGGTKSRAMSNLSPNATLPQQVSICQPLDTESATQTSSTSISSLPVAQPSPSKQSEETSCPPNNSEIIAEPIISESNTSWIQNSSINPPSNFEFFNEIPEELITDQLQQQDTPLSSLRETTASPASSVTSHSPGPVYMKPLPPKFTTSYSSNEHSSSEFSDWNTDMYVFPPYNQQGGRRPFWSPPLPPGHHNTPSSFLHRSHSLPPFRMTSYRQPLDFVS